MFICWPKINVFLDISQTYYKPVILGTLDMHDYARNTKLVILGNLDTPGHTPKVMLSIWRNFWCLSADQKSTFSLIYHKDITNLLFWELWTCMVTQHPKWYYQLVENVCAYLSAKGLNSSPRFSGDVVKISKLLILGRLDMPGHAHPNW